MKVYNVVVKEGGLSEQVIYVPRHLFKQMKEQKLNLIFGNRMLKVDVRIHRKPVRVIQISRLTAEALEVPLKQHLLAYRIGSRLVIGPIIGIFSHKDPVEVQRGEFIKYLQMLAEEGRRSGYLVCIIVPHKIKAGATSVTATILTEQGTWQRQVLPWPDVVYNQIISRNLERSETVQQAKKVIADWARTQFFNEGYLNKWETTLVLLQVPELKQFLPDTVLYHNNSLLKFLSKHKEIYIKPDRGSLGKGIIKINRSGKGYLVQQKIGRSKIITRYPNTQEELLKIVGNMTKGRNFIMQQGLRLAEVQGSVFDLRVLMQKNIDGKWYRSKLFGRLAAKGSFTSNISTGGKGLSAEVLINKAFSPFKAEKIIKAVRSSSLLIADYFEKAYGHLLGELGLDFGVDVNGRLWLIEINSKPHKSLTSQEGSEALALKALLRPLDYARHLWITRKWR